MPRDDIGVFMFVGSICGIMLAFVFISFCLRGTTGHSCDVDSHCRNADDICVIRSIKKEENPTWICLPKDVSYSKIEQ